MSSNLSMSQKDALLGEQTQQNDTHIMPDTGLEVRGPWNSMKLCLSDLAQWPQRRGERILNWQYGSALARIFDRQEYHDATEMQLMPGNEKFLMLVFSGKNDVDKLHQVRLADQYISSDAGFFQLLRKEYYTNRERYHGWNPWWRKVRGIFFVEFVTRTPTSVQHSVQLLATGSVPGARVHGWIRARTAGRLDPPSSSFITRLFDDPEAAGPDMITFLEIPRKLYTGIPDPDGQIGWGLYFLEGSRWTLIYSLLFLWVLIGCALLLSLLFKA